MLDYYQQFENVLNGPVPATTVNSGEAAKTGQEQDSAKQVDYVHPVPIEKVAQTGRVTRERELERLQGQFPFLPIDPPLTTYKMITVDAGDWVAVQIPSSAKMYRVSTGFGHAFLSPVPVTTIQPNTATHEECLLLPENTITNWRICTRHVMYVGCVSNSTVLSIEFFSQL